MNKDVVYIEPEDDITDILGRIKNSAEKVVALVPPKKLGVLRSVVNEKLIAKTAKAEDKVVVIVTTDQALLKLAISAGLPVAKTLQSRPVMPSEASDLLSKKETEVIEEEDEDEDAPVPEESFSRPAARKTDKKADRAPDEVINSVEIEEEADEDEEDDAPKKKSKSSAKNSSKIPSLDKYRKFIVAGVVGGVALIAFLIWAFGFAPAARIIVAVKTTPSNFSESVTFTSKPEEENVSEGKFYLEEQKSEDKASADFTATGKKDVGEKASGTLNISATVSQSSPSVSVPAGTTFTYGSLKYVSTKGITFDGSGEDNSCSVTAYIHEGCSLSATISVQAAENGENYNIPSGNSGWSSALSTVSVTGSSEMTGGTSKTITIVTKDDVEKAKADLESSDGASKDDLKEAFGDDIFVIESSYSLSVGDAVVSPRVGEEVKSGVTPTLSVTTTATMYGVEKSKVEEFIRGKSEQTVSEDQRLYSIGDPFFERYLKSKDSKTKKTTITARLKTTTQAGPKISEEEILEKSKGQTFKEVRTLLKSINGIKSVDVEPSFGWVRRVPKNEDKVKIVLTVDGEGGEDE